MCVLPWHQDNLTEKWCDWSRSQPGSDAPDVLSTDPSAAGWRTHHPHGTLTGLHITQQALSFMSIFTTTKHGFENFPHLDHFGAALLHSLKLTGLLQSGRVFSLLLWSHSTHTSFPVGADYCCLQKRKRPNRFSERTSPHQSRDEEFHRGGGGVSAGLLCCKLLSWDGLPSNSQPEALHLPSNHISQFLYL